MSADRARSHFEASLEAVDPALAALLAAEARRESGRLDLVASENYISLAQLEASGSRLGNTTVEGYPGARFLGASPHVDAIEQLAIDRAREVFGARFANVQPHSGSQANQAVFLALLRPGDTVLSMSLAAGGHFSHGAASSVSGQWFNAVHYGVRADGWIDEDAAAELALAHRPRLVIAGASAYPRAIDFARFAEIARSVDAHFLVDMAHVAGLVAAGLFPDPVRHADVVTSTTYKNFRGVRGGLILCNDAGLAGRFDAALCPGLQGTPLMTMIAGKAVAFHEAMQPAFAAYGRQVLANARTLAASLADAGLAPVTGGTDTPFVVADLHGLGLSAARATTLLEAVHVGASAALTPRDGGDFSRASALRLGVSALTSRGMVEADIARVADIVVETLRRGASNEADAPDASPTSLRRLVLALGEQFPTY